MSQLKPYIVFVDDDEDDRDLIFHSCEQLNKVERAHFLCSGEELLNFLATIKIPVDYPSLIVLDVKMLGLNAEETLLQLKAHPSYNHIPVIIYSTDSYPKERYSEMGAESLFKNPSPLVSGTRTSLPSSIT